MSELVVADMANYEARLQPQRIGLNWLKSPARGRIGQLDRPRTWLAPFLPPTEHTSQSRRR